MTKTYTNDDVVRVWTSRIVRRQPKLHLNDTHEWFSLWCGFVCGLDREDVANDEDYMRLGVTRS